MTRYAGNAAAIRSLVRDQEVHRDVYVSEEVFQLEMEHMFPNSWVYVGHDSQVPNAGDYYGTTIGTQPVLLVRHTDGTVKVLHNRCPHKGTASRPRPAATPESSSAAPTTPGASRPTAPCSRFP